MAAKAKVINSIKTEADASADAAAEVESVSVASSFQKQSDRISKQIWCKVGERYCNARLQPNPKVEAESMRARGNARFKEQAWAADWAPQKVVARPTVRKAALQKQSNLARESLAAVSRLR